MEVFCFSAVFGAGFGKAALAGLTGGFAVGHGQVFTLLKLPFSTTDCVLI